MLSLGIIGQGSFGKFAAEKLDQHFVIKAYDTYAVVSAETSASLEDVCQCDYLMLAIPLSSYVELLPSIKSKLAPQTIVIDVSSVKVEPLRLLREYLVPEQLYVAMHPLFGPQSAAKTLEGFPVVFCESNLSPEKLQKMKNFCTELGLKVAEMTADEHDQQMAVVHALTFFVARSLNEFGVDEMKFRTPSFQKLIDLAELDRDHSEDLFKTILLGNPYAAGTRQKYLKSVQKLDQDLRDGK